MTESVVKVENEKNLLTAFVAGFKNMFDFKTRASKYDYWAFVFANVLIGFVVLGVSAVLAMILTSTFLFWTFCNIYWLGFDLFALHDYARVATDVINLITSIYGFIVWSRSEQKRKVLKSNQGVNENEY